MAQDVDSAALSWVAKALQLSTAGQQQTLFIDERLEQTLDVGSLIRRGLALANTEGIYIGNIRTVHTGVAAVVQTVVNPWALAGAETAPFPAAIPSIFDLWLIGCSAKTVAAAGNFDSARFDMTVPATNRIFGTGGPITLASYENERAIAGGDALVVHSNSPQMMYTRLGLRMIRGSTLRWTTLNVGATSPQYDLDLLFGLFPAGMGQDAVAG